MQYGEVGVGTSTHTLQHLLGHHRATTDGRTAFLRHRPDPFPPRAAPASCAQDILRPARLDRQPLWQTHQIASTTCSRPARGRVTVGWVALRSGRRTRVGPGTSSTGSLQQQHFGFATVVVRQRPRPPRCRHQQRTSGRDRRSNSARAYRSGVGLLRRKSAGLVCETGSWSIPRPPARRGQWPRHGPADQATASGRNVGKSAESVSTSAAND